MKSKRITVQHVLILLATFPVAAYAVAALRDPYIRSPIFTQMVTEIPWSGYLHIIPGTLALLLGGLLLSRRVRRTRLWMHKSLGWLYGVCVLLSTLGAHVGNYVSESGAAARMAFLVLGILWPLVTFAGIPFDDLFDRPAHGRLMKVSYALTFSAVTLRIYLSSMLALAIPFDTAYPIAAWGSFVGNVTFVLLVFRAQTWLRKRKLARLLETAGK